MRIIAKPQTSDLDLIQGTLKAMFKLQVLKVNSDVFLLRYDFILFFGAVYVIIYMQHPSEFIVNSP